MMRRLSVLIPLLLLGCHQSREADVVGRWTLPSKIFYVFDAAKTYTIESRRVAASGKWSLEGDKVTVTQTVVNGKPIADLKASLQAQRSTLPPNLQAVIDRLGTPETYTLDADGKSMTRQQDGRTVTLTKS